MPSSCAAKGRPSSSIPVTRTTCCEKRLARQRIAHLDAHRHHASRRRPHGFACFAARRRANRSRVGSKRCAYLRMRIVRHPAKQRLPAGRRAQHSRVVSRRRHNCGVLNPHLHLASSIHRRRRQRRQRVPSGRCGRQRRRARGVAKPACGRRRARPACGHD